MPMLENGIFLQLTSILIQLSIFKLFVLEWEFSIEIQKMIRNYGYFFIFLCSFYTLMRCAPTLDLEGGSASRFSMLFPLADKLLGILIDTYMSMFRSCKRFKASSSS